MITCSKCGHSVDDALRFCTECGTPLTPPPTIAWQHFTPANVVAAETKPSEAGSGRAMLTVIGTVVATVLLLSLGGLAFWFFFARSSRETTQPTPTQSSRASDTQPLVATDPARPSIKTKQNVSQSTPPTANASSAKQDVIASLEAWAASVRAHDLNSHMTYYAERLHTYYLKRDVSSAYVRSTLDPAYTRYYKLDVSLSNIVVTLDTSGAEATVTLDKTYSFEGDKKISGSGKEMLWLSKEAGHWLITGVRDLQVYYKR